MSLSLHTDRLELRPLPAAAAKALPGDRATAAGLLGAALAPDWPLPDLLDVLPSQAAAEADSERFGVWAIVESASQTVIGDAGFMGPPGPDRSLEIGFSLVPDRRRKGYAGEAVRALVPWALRQPGVSAVDARCDPANVASVRVLERAGFSLIGEEAGKLHWRSDGGDDDDAV